MNNKLKILLIVPFGLERSGFILFARSLQKSIQKVGISIDITYIGYSPYADSNSFRRFATTELLFSHISSCFSEYEIIVWGGVCLTEAEVNSQIELTSRLVEKDIYWFWERPGEFPVLPEDVEFTSIHQPFCKGFFVFNKFQTNELLSYGVSKKQIHLISTGVDTSVYHPPKSDAKKILREKLLWETDNFYCLYVGRFTKRKGVDFLINAWIKYLPTSHAKRRLVLVGSDFGDNNSVEIELRKTVQKHDHIDLINYVDNRLVYYQAADILILPGLVEGEPMVLVEAMSCGLPVIASNIPGHQRLVIDGETGFLFTPNDVTALGSVLVNGLSDANLIKEMGIRARQKALENRDISKISEVFLDIWKNGIGE